MASGGLEILKWLPTIKSVQKRVVIFAQRCVRPIRNRSWKILFDHQHLKNQLQFCGFLRKMREKLRAHLRPAITVATQLQSARPLRFESLEQRHLMARVIFSQIPINLMDLDQLMLVLVNRARANPQAEAERQGIGLNDGLASKDFISATPKQPLAPDVRLTLAATRHSQDMIDRDYFKHDAMPPAPNGITPSDRATKVGFVPFVAENIAFSSTNERTALDSAIELHGNLFKSTTGHRSNMLNGEYNVAGIGVVAGDYTKPIEQGGQTVPAVFMTEMFGNTSTEVNRFADGYITGVVYRDNLIDDDFYSIGEGVSGVEIEARTPTGDVYSTATGDSGAYRLAVPNGTYTVVSRTGEKIVGLGTAAIANKNVKLDLMTDRIPAEPSYELDANRDGLLTPLDALVVINFLNLNVPGSNLPPESRASYDIDKNTIIEPLDVLIVINAINRQSGEGEFKTETKNDYSKDQIQSITEGMSSDDGAEFGNRPDKKLSKTIQRFRIKR